MPPYPKEKLKECIRRCDTRNADDFKATLREIRTLVDKNDLDLSSETLKWSPPSSPHAKRGDPPPPHHKNTSNVFIFTLLTILNSRCMLQDKNSETTVFNCWLELLNMIFKHYAEIPPKKVIANGAPFSIYGIRQKRQDLMYPIKMVLRFKPYWIISKKEEDKEESMADRNAALILAMFHRLGYNFHDENQDLESHLYTALHENKRHCFDFLATQMRLKFKKNDPPPLIHAIYYDLKTHANPQKSKLKFLMDCCGSQHDRLKLNPNQTDFADYDLADEDKTGGTALHFIIHKELYNSKQQAIMYLQNIGVDPHAVNRLNKTGIDLLKEKIERASRTLQRAMDPHLQRLYVLYGYIANWMDQTNHHSDRVSTMAQMGDRDSDVEEVHSEEEQQHSAASTASALASAAEIRPSTARERALHGIIDGEPQRAKKSHAVLVSTTPPPRDVRHAERASPHKHKIQSRKNSSGEEEESEESEEEEGSKSEESESESDNKEQPPIRIQSAALTSKRQPEKPKRQNAVATSSSHPHHRELPRAQKQRNQKSESEKQESEVLLESESEESESDNEQPPIRSRNAALQSEKPNRQNAAATSSSHNYHREQPHHHHTQNTAPHLQQRQARRGEPQWR